MDSLGPTRQAVTVGKGGDVVTVIRSISQDGTRIVWIVSAFGSVHNVTLLDGSGIPITHLGTFDILSLNTKNGCELSISLVQVGNGRIIAGNVTGELLAASPIQLNVGISSLTGVVPAATHAAAAPAVPGQSSATVQIPFYQFFPDGTETESTVSRGRAAIPFYQFNI